MTFLDAGGRPSGAGVLGRQSFIMCYLLLLKGFSKATVLIFVLRIDFRF